MKIKRVRAQDIRQAIKQVREELGPDAVILSNRRVNNEVEIVAAIDYDESMLDQPLRREELPALRDTVKPPASAGAQQKVNRVAEDSAGQIERFYFADDTDSARGEKKPQNPQNPQSTDGTQHESLVREVEYLRTLVRERAAPPAITPLELTDAEILMYRLQYVGFSTQLAQRWLQSHINSPQARHSLDNLWRQIQGDISRSLPIAGDDILDKGGVVALVGPTGVGKTTTIAKLTARYALRHGSKDIALITTDNYRVGAHDQLAVYANIIGVPLHVVGPEDSLDDILARVKSRRLVLIDTAGTSQRDSRIEQQLATIARSRFDIRVYLVLAAATQHNVLRQTVASYQRLVLDGCIVTKLDEALTLGAILSAVIESQLPVAYVTDGQRVPEDLQLARTNSLVNLALSGQDQNWLEVDQQAQIDRGFTRTGIGRVHG